MRPPRSTLAISRAQRTGFGGLLSPPGFLSSREAPPGEPSPQGRGGGAEPDWLKLGSPGSGCNDLVVTWLVKP
jgi:hypothetical protein